ncbi:hypothetical protein TRFO_24291 [Tritrichomonas foetus]|uniref:mitogen-activated protein kinase kinase n=1 Tax=Tritrichomonas foetus TaxID=1144522 RepID=A0A1J4K7L3_9EUKA|nr:hypothetical protein TRFO_24291 [Tritrichomonas foetus]|eukprot:OHT07473.1 hypothetical protein TRFO_24291 [Tritrichomonas foetus]
MEMLKETSFDMSKYTKICTLGGGACGEVNLLRENETGIFRAIKISRFKANNGAPLLYFMREVQTLSENKHPTIMQIVKYGLPETDKQFYPWIEMEFIPGGTLFDLIARAYENKVSIDPTRVLIILFGTAYSLAFLHHRNVIHRDIKSSNILLDENLEPHLADFGFARDIIPEITKLSRPRTVNYAPPEMFDEKIDYDARCDVYSLGMMMYEVLNLNIPFAGLPESQIAKNIMNGNIPRLDESSPYYDLFIQCTQVSFQQRPVMLDVARYLNDLSRVIPGIDIKTFDSYRDRITYYDQSPYPIYEHGTLENIQRAAAFSTDAMHQLGWIYFHGAGVPQDNMKAIEYFSMACELNNEKALESLIGLIDEEKLPMWNEDKYEEYVSKLEQIQE